VPLSGGKYKGSFCFLRETPIPKSLSSNNENEYFYRYNGWSAVIDNVKIVTYLAMLHRPSLLAKQAVVIFWLLYPQLYPVIDKSDAVKGTSVKKISSLPASSSKTDHSGFSVSRLATTDPPEPDWFPLAIWLTLTEKVYLHQPQQNHTLLVY